MWWRRSPLVAFEPHQNGVHKPKCPPPDADCGRKCPGSAGEVRADGDCFPSQKRRKPVRIDDPLRLRLGLVAKSFAAESW